jgi:hypothetical protein
MYKKVYFDKEHYGCWWVDDLEDIYLFKSVDFETNLEKDQVISWSRNEEVPDGFTRVYDFEIDGEKYYFLFKSMDEGKYQIVPKYPMELERLLRERNIFFVGETIN